MFLEQLCHLVHMVTLDVSSSVTAGSKISFLATASVAGL